MFEKLPLVVANFKANLSWNDLELWIEKVNTETISFPGTIIMSPSAPFLSSCSQKLKENKSHIQLSSQDISKFEQGAYTGEYAASQLSDIVAFAIIGHSERRRYFNENDEGLNLKVENCVNAAITPIFCVEDSQKNIPSNVKVVAYEPVFAIGTGKPDSPENAKKVASEIKNKGEYLILYGGSVNNNNTKDFLERGVLDGLLVGGASLDPESFIGIINSASY